MTSAPLATTISPATAEANDAVLFAAFPKWQDNGHDVPSAVLHVHQSHLSETVREAAGQAYDLLLSTPVIWRAIETEFEARARASRQAVVCW